MFYESFVYVHDKLGTGITVTGGQMKWSVSVLVVNIDAIDYTVSLVIFNRLQINQPCNKIRITLNETSNWRIWTYNIKLKYFIGKFSPHFDATCSGVRPFSSVALTFAPYECKIFPIITEPKTEKFATSQSSTFRIIQFRKG